MYPPGGVDDSPQGTEKQWDMEMYLFVTFAKGLESVGCEGASFEIEARSLRTARCPEATKTDTR